MNEGLFFEYIDGTADVKLYGGFESSTGAVGDEPRIDVKQPQRAAILRVIDGGLYALSTDSPPSIRQSS